MNAVTALRWWVRNHIAFETPEYRGLMCALDVVEAADADHYLDDCESDCPVQVALSNLRSAVEE